jgi:putative regulatory protein, FmdB family
MPIYEYQCEKCHHHLEALQKIADKPLRECPECGKHTLKRLVSAPLFRLAGSGWYETDFKSDKETKRNLAGREEAAKEAPKDGAKPDAKPEAATKKTVASKPATRSASAKKPGPVAKKAPAKGRVVARKTARKR